jgi:hypothetical protein
MSYPHGYFVEHFTFHKHGEHLTPWPRPCNLATLLLHQWDVLAIVGPSSTGKSTLLEILVDSLSPSPAPELLLLDGGAAASPDLRRVLGYVTQRDVLFSLLTVREALLFIPRLRLGATLPVPAKDMHACGRAPARPDPVPRRRHQGPLRRGAQARLYRRGGRPRPRGAHHLRPRQRFRSRSWARSTPWQRRTATPR